MRYIVLIERHDVEGDSERTFGLAEGTGPTQAIAMHTGSREFRSGTLIVAIEYPHNDETGKVFRYKVEKPTLRELA